MKPMLAGTLKDISKVKYPVIAQRKLDGIRAMVVHGKLLSRTLKPIPNVHVRALLEKPEYEGFDGELIVGPATADDCYRKTVSFVMGEDKPDIGDLRYFVFDQWNSSRDYLDRYRDQTQKIEASTGWVYPLLQLANTVVHSESELLELEAAWVAKGYEGVILRAPNGLYKFGRGTESKGDLLKLKRFTDAEAVVIGVEEEMANENVAFTNELGRTARSTAKAGKVGKNRLGKLICRTPEGVEFGIGTGFSQAERISMWSYRQELPGKIAKYKSFPVGVKDKPRFPVFLGWRHPDDMS